ncbi:putative serine/threonine-protein kinase A [Diplonema papillatum]|nr:putative serine/threonine-protein kinase A [Diplonema papillatum]
MAAKGGGILAAIPAKSTEDKAGKEEAGPSFSSVIGEKGTTAKYFKKKKIGKGSYGDAWLVESSVDGTVCVAKVMDLPKMTNRDIQYAYSEIKCLSLVSHPNVIKYYEDKEEGDSLLIIMEFADGGDLDRQVKQRAANGCRYFQEHEILFMFLQLCMAIDHIHGRKMLHRDIKGANIFLTSTGVIKLGDFGFSHEYEETVSNAVANTFCGTPYYLAPELWENKKYGKKADVWSLGVLLYEMLALKRPYTAQNMRGLMEKVLEGKFPPPPPHYSQDMRDLVSFILQRDPEKRPTVREIFELPYVREGLKLFLDAVAKSPKISEDTKKDIGRHVNEILNAISAPKPDSKDATHEGPVKKLGGPFGRSWKERYLYLRNGELIICERKEDHKSGKPLKVDQIKSVCPISTQSAQKEHVFGLNINGLKATWLQAPTQEEMNTWIEKIQISMGVF